MSIEISHSIRKAAELFVDRNFVRPSIAGVWCFRAARANVVWASDGHTMFAANDREGRGFGRKPVQLGSNPKDKLEMPNWQKIVAAIPDRRKSLIPLPFNPKYHARVMRAARILDVTCGAMSVSAQGDPIVYTLGPDAWACVMPMREVEGPPVPAWLRRVAA